VEEKKNTGIRFRKKEEKGRNFLYSIEGGGGKRNLASVGRGRGLQSRPHISSAKGRWGKLELLFDEEKERKEKASPEALCSLATKGKRKEEKEIRQILIIVSREKGRKETFEKKEGEQGRTGGEDIRLLNKRKKKRKGSLQSYAVGKKGSDLGYGGYTSAIVPGKKRKRGN